MRPYLPTAALTLVMVGLLVTVSILACSGSLVYTLDDPYIHLALARNVKAGHYGINPGEWSSPSSSILWPILLALTPSWQFEVWPLLINAACAAGCSCLMHMKLSEAGLKPWTCTVLSLAFALGINLIGLVMTGMEHSLQVFLSMLIALHLTSQHCSRLTYIALLLLPLIRYECLAISYPALTYLWLKGDRVRASAVAALIAAAVVGFSFFLHSHGLPWLPCSVIAKSEGLRLIDNIRSEPALLTLLVWVAYVYRQRPLELILLVLAPAGGFLILGRTGWFGRYETFIVAYLSVFALSWQGGQSPHTAPAVTTSSSRSATPWVLIALAVSFPSLLLCTLRTPQAARNTWQMQAVMATVAHDLAEPVAVFDLGLVALRSDQRVLDLGGLGSYKALQARRNAGGDDSLWLQDILRAEGVEYAFVYETVFKNTPATWIKVADLMMPGKVVTVASGHATLFATSEAAAKRLETAIRCRETTGWNGSTMQWPTPHHSPAVDH